MKKGRKPEYFISYLFRKEKGQKTDKSRILILIKIIILLSDLKIFKKLTSPLYGIKSINSFILQDFNNKFQNFLF